MTSYPSHIIPFLNLTSIQEKEDIQTMMSLCKKAIEWKTTSICIPQKFIKNVWNWLERKPIHITTLINAEKTNDIDKIFYKTKEAIDDGADEIDLCLPYSDNTKTITDIIKSCKKYLTKKKRLNAIIETNTLQTTLSIQKATQQAIQNGATGIKTNIPTDKQSTPIEHVNAILEVLKDHPNIHIDIHTTKSTIEELENNLRLTEKIMGKEWTTPKNIKLSIPFQNIENI